MPAPSGAEQVIGGANFTGGGGGAGGRRAGVRRVCASADNADRRAAIAISAIRRVISYFSRGVPPPLADAIVCKRCALPDWHGRRRSLSILSDTRKSQGHAVERRRRGIAEFDQLEKFHARPRVVAKRTVHRAGDGKRILF